MDENPATSQAYGIRSIPTMILIKGGDTIEQVTGAVSKDVIKRMFATKGIDDPSF